MVRPESLKNGTFQRFTRFVLLFTLACPLSEVAGQDVGKAEAESRLSEVTLEISKLRQQLDSSRADHQQEQARMREVDLAIQAADLNYRNLETQRKHHLDELAQLERQREAFLASLDVQLGQLAEQVRSAYKMGSQSRVKLVLNQDDPARLGRMLAYYEFLNRNQIREISGLKDALTTLDEMQQSIDLELSGIERVQNEQRTALEELAGQRLEREAVVAQLASRIDNEQARLSELEQNRKDLETLLEKLSDVLADIPANLGDRAGIAGQKGKLPMPLKGPVRHAFGQQRAGGLKWQGWLIESPVGTETGAVAYGRVAFADWLRGYGLMIIIDHGQGFLSLYGNNESLLREVGAWVEPGEIISIVGSNPGNDQGLYFELRKDGKAVDPAAWIAR